jgi:hypothetical protein
LGLVVGFWKAFLEEVIQEKGEKEEEKEGKVRAPRGGEEKDRETGAPGKWESRG